jgi:tetratricopeptide (TPR) repeat protein
LEIPEFLLTQIREAKAVLVFGAGASIGALGKTGKQPPDGRQLARLISERFLGGKFKDAPLSQVGELAISESRIFDVQEFIREQFEDLEPAAYHRLIPRFRWHGLATTNYDRVIEKAYEREPKRLQTLRPIITNDDGMQDAQRSPDNVLLLKLHGCISRTASPECPLILTTDQYVQHKKGRARLFQTLQEWAYERPLIFIGHSIQDTDLRAVLLELAVQSEHRARSFCVVPDAEEMAVRFWETKKIALIKMTGQEFFETLDRQISENVRSLGGLLRSEEAHPIAERFRDQSTVISDGCRTFLASDVEHVRSVVAEHLDPKHFYRGMNPGWSAIEQNLDARRELADTILADVVLANRTEHSETCEVVLVKGYAGSGKSVLLRRIAWDAAREYNAIALMLQPQGALVAAAIRELVSVVDDPIFIFVDDAADRAREIATLVRELGTDGKRLTLILAERINEWNIGGGPAEPYVSEEYEVGYLDRKEVGSLIDLLERHRALGTLENVAREDRFKAFEERAGRQLLVALHEATLGLPFEQIIKDEYDKIVPLDAQDMYLSVCVLNRLNVAVRAGVISRMHDLPFDFFRDRFFKPLEHVVYTKYDSILRDHTYASRHPHIAEIVFQRVLTDPELRLDKYLRCLKALNVSYSTDEYAFRQMVRGRVVQDLFPSNEMARLVFKTATDTIGRDPFLLQQMALYEMNAGGSLGRAGELLDAAAAAAPNDPSIKHSKAELLLKLADVARTPLERDHRLQEAMTIASALRRDIRRGGGSHAFHTIVKVGLRRLEVVLKEDGEAVSHESVSAAIRAVEESLLDGLQQFPDDSYLRTSEADLATALRDSKRAIAAMQAAFRANPRNSSIAVRLSKSLEAGGQSGEAQKVLKTALENNPGDKKLNFAFAKFLLNQKTEVGGQVEYHLQRSFTEGDSNYEAQLLYARQLYLRGDAETSRNRFKGLGLIRVGPTVRDKMRYPIEGWFAGGVTKTDATYCFVARDGVGDWVFAHRNDIDPKVWASIKVGTRLRFRIAFKLRGPAAFDVEIELT